MNQPLFSLLCILAALFGVAVVYRYRIKLTEYLRVYLLTQLKKSQIFLNKNDNNIEVKASKNDIYFQSLAPNHDADEDGQYSSAINWALKQDDIRNIAITGPYGAGKTSVLKTFEKNNPSIRFVNVSLAAFNKDLTKIPASADIPDPSKPSDDEKRQRDYLIEKSILQQIIYKETKEKLPMSRFNRLAKINRWKHFLLVMASLLLLLSFLMILKVDSATLVMAVNAFPDLAHGYKFLTAGIGLILLLSASYLLIDTLKHRSLNKISLLKGDIELSEKTGASILNLHIDEIIYFFEETDYRVVVFEDLDRHDGIEIFTKLREINILINQCEQVGRRIVFIYAVKDDIFDEVSRTKFFEFIIPIIPIVNSSNSREILLRELRKTPYLGSYDGQIDEKLVSDLTLYINDMRLLLNIFNEFIIYSAQLIGQIKLEPRKLLAFIVYKNKFPSDFSSLNKGKGDIAEVFDNKNKLILKLSTKIDEEIENIAQKIVDKTARFKMNAKDSELQLRALYLLKYVEKHPGLTTIRVNGRDSPLSHFLNEDGFSELIHKTDNIYVINSRVTHGLSSFDKIQESVDANHSYKERLKLITEPLEKQLSDNYIAIDKLREQKSMLKGQSIAYLLENHSDKKADILGDLIQEKLLSYLLSNGLIDEDYYYYLSYFHPGSQTPQDINFLLAVNEAKRLNITHKINSPNEILNQLSERDLSSKYTLNLELLDHMYSVSSPKLKYLLTNFDKFSEHEFEFVLSFIKYSSFSSKFIADLADKWGTFISEVMDDDLIPEVRKNQLLQLLFQNASLEVINKQNAHFAIQNYLAETKDTSLIFSKVDFEKVKSILQQLNIKIRYISYIKLPSLFEFIAENDMYYINHENIINIFDFFGLKYKGEFPNITEIQGIDNPNIYAYIENNMNAYVPNILLESSETHSEPNDVIIDLLNRSQLSIENKERIIQRLKFSIFTLNDVKSDIDILWPLLLDHKKIEVSWDNVFEASFAFDSKQPAENLWEYVADDVIYDVLSKEPIPSLYQADAPAFFDKLIVAEATTAESLKKIVAHFSKRIDFLSDYDLTSEILSVLVKADKVSLTDENIEELRQKSPSDASELIIQNIKDFVAEGSNLFQVNSNELIGALNSQDISAEDKLEIISKYQDSLMRNSETLSYVWDILRNSPTNIFLNDDLVAELCKEISSISEKAKLLSTQIRYRDWVSVSRMLTDSEVTEFNQIGTRKTMVLLSNTSGESKLAENLLAQGYISTYSIEGKRDETIKINSKRK